MTEMTAVTVRSAISADLEVIVALADARRRQHETYQPTFWRPATDAAAMHRPYLADLIEDDDVLTLVALDGPTVAGFLVGRLAPAPPVYDPGGPTCTVDDFAVAHPDQWTTVGTSLLRTVQGQARRRGAVQVVVVCGRLDESKRAMLEQSDLSIASEWWVAPLSG